MLRLLTMNVTQLNEDELFQAFYSQMSDFRKKKIDRLRFRKDKNLSLGAGILLNRGLQPYGLCERQMHYALRENEKPYFQNEPSICFNLSHSDTQVLAAVSDHEVGCDVERIKPIDLQLAKRFFAPEEYTLIMAAQTEKEKTLLFYRLWTLKESFIKCTGMGMRLPLNQFSIDLKAEPIQVKCSSFSEQYSFAEYSQIPDYCISCCIQGENPKPQLECINDLLQIAASI